jgi:hypothetical protein
MRNLTVLSLAVIGCAAHAPVPQTSAQPAPAAAMSTTSATTKAIEPPSTAASASGNAPEAAPSASAAPSATAAAELPAKQPPQRFARFGAEDLAQNGAGHGEGVCLCEPSKIEHEPAKTAQIRLGATIVNGDMPGEVIFRVVRKDNARLLSCYQRGLNANPHLEGRITAKVVIDEAGAIANNSDGGSDLPDADVVACVLGELRKLRFPARKAGSTATVILPLYLRPPPTPEAR